MKHNEKKRIVLMISILALVVLLVTQLDSLRTLDFSDGTIWKQNVGSGFTNTAKAWIEGDLIFTDGEIKHYKSNVANVKFANFSPDSNEPLKNMQRSEFIVYVDYSDLSYPYSTPVLSNKQIVKVNGIEVPNVLKTGTEMYNTIDSTTKILKAFGLSINPDFLKSQIESKNVKLKTGDVITWTMNTSGRFDVLIGGAYHDGYIENLSVSMNFYYVDPADLFSTGNTDLTGQQSVGQPYEKTSDGVIINNDYDDDGIINVNDKCPERPETYNGVEDHDGCPDVIPPSYFTNNPNTLNDSSNSEILCLAVYDPVCGADGKTYSNGCDALRNGQQVSYKGTCESKDATKPDFTDPFTDEQKNTATGGMNSGLPVFDSGIHGVCDPSVIDCDEYIKTLGNIGSSGETDLSIFLIIGVIIIVITILVIVLIKVKK